MNIKIPYVYDVGGLEQMEKDKMREFVVTCGIIVVALPIVAYIVPRMGDHFDRAAREEAIVAGRIKCGEYGKFFEREVKWDDKMGCATKVRGEWERVELR